MISTILLSSVLASQAQGPLPKNAAIVYSGLPALQATAPSLKLVSHSVTGTLSKETVTFSTVSLYKNTSPNAYSVTLKLPVNAQNPVLGRGYNIDFSATWDRTPVKASPYREEQALLDEQVKLRNGAAWTKFIRFKALTLPVKASATHALRISFTVPIGKSGLDGLQRIVAYDLSGASSYGWPVEHIPFSLKYTPEIMFQRIAAQPAYGWQIGPHGAFFQVRNYTPGTDALARFLFYPGGFDKIGEEP